MSYTDTDYDAEFYANLYNRVVSSADAIVPIVLSHFPASSVVDIGCGDGAWLRAFAKYGLRDFLGIDGAYVPLDMLNIPRQNFRDADLTELTSVGRRFDLACSLEVAEHLPEQCAAQFVKLLSDAAPVVIFSAAIPRQGGNRHINEQWQSYWMDLFAARGYRAFDCVRPLVYENPSVEWWYRQNLIIYCDEAHHPNGIAPIAGPFEANRVDPDMLAALYRQIDELTPDSIRSSITMIKRDVTSLRHSLLRRLMP